ncbi:MAG TPA: NAD(P)H-binding protein [Kofleriaceae bacterium]|nr:NAD(P)H-binding protein [Kofleriaceae bacterium]
MATILLTGATGCIGSHVVVALEAAGHTVRCATRSVARAKAHAPGLRWVAADLTRPETLAPALEGCDAAVFLVHAMGAGREDDYPARERESAQAFIAAAANAGVRRVVYLGGVVPAHGVSRHLRSRQRTGEILRGGTVETIELRAAMVIGAGSASWIMVRDLAGRLPAMVLPRWLRNHSYPIAIEDVVKAIVAALALPAGRSRIYELPGPERLTHREVLARTAAAMGHHRLMVSVPVLTPHLSSYWIALVTRTPLAMAKELVEGVRADLEPTGESLWPAIGARPMPIDEAIRRALADDAAPALPSPAMRVRLAAVG